MHHSLGFRLASLALLLAGCASLPAPVCQAPDSVRVFQAADIGEQWIDFIWVEVPDSAAPGTHPGRLFVLSADPVGAVVPSMIDLPCEVSAGESMDYAPAQVEFDFQGEGRFITSYSWKSCAACSECYMHWTFSLDLQGSLRGDSLVADVVLNETFHSAPMKIVSLELPEVTRACTQPHITCRPDGTCSRIKYEPRD